MDKERRREERCGLKTVRVPVHGAQSAWAEGEGERALEGYWLGEAVQTIMRAQGHVLEASGCRSTVGGVE